MDRAYEIVGVFSERVVSLLNLPIPAGTEISLSTSSIAHIQKRHPEVHVQFIDKIGEILSNPDYVGYSARKNTVDFIRAGRVRLRVPVRPSSDGMYFVRSLFKLHKRDFERLKRSGSIIPVDND